MLRFLQKLQKYKTRTIKINGKKFDALVADSLIKRMIGLMFRQKLQGSQCMLFVFHGEGYQSIWMYNMQFPTDVIWVSSSMKIVDMKEHFIPCKTMSKCPPYIPSAKAKYVIEFNSGKIKSNGIRMNSKVSGID